MCNMDALDNIMNSIKIRKSVNEKDIVFLKC